MASSPKARKRGRRLRLSRVRLDLGLDLGERSLDTRHDVVARVRDEVLALHCMRDGLTQMAGAPQ